MSVEAYLKTSCVHCQGHIEYPPEAAGMTVPCPHCQATTALPGSLDAARRGLRRWLILLGLLLLVGAGSAWLLQRARLGAGSEVASSVLPDPPPADLQRLEQLAFWDIALERKEGSTITHAVARVLNESKSIRYGIEVKLELLDEVGRSVGTAKDYIERLEPGQDAYVRALVIKRDAVAARVLQVTEQ